MKNLNTKRLFVMKKLLITLVLLSLFTLLNADDKRWIKDQNGCKRNLALDSKVKEIRWKGTCKGGFLSGKGLLYTLWVHTPTPFGHPADLYSDNFEKNRLDF
jgi:hypothetical protein